ncbi:MAG: hypothetical protein KF787_02615 [Phycisphaeraceae bacterium]|nr:hypothetical protein [Phycisphaerae bacterium]MBX3391519.1 hypothetical protein [Phycisphaeraceae bacterium]
MNWVVFSLILWGLMGLELGLKDALRLGETPVAPSFVMALAVVVSLAAPPNAALWACLAIGVTLDLTNPIEVIAGGPDRTVLGPYALGYVLACQLVLTMRGLMMRKNILTVGFLALFCSLVSHVVVTAIFAIRMRYDAGVLFLPTQELMWRFGSALYSGVAGVVLGAALLPLLGSMGLSIGPARRFARRAS